MDEWLIGNLFQLGDFTLTSGQKASWKINCGALTPGDWAALAHIAIEELPLFGTVEGVPQGGLPFAEALRHYAVPGCQTLLIADDVITTGGSMERFRASRDAVGVVVFCRGECPAWVTPLFHMIP